MSSSSPYPSTPRQLAEWLERVPVELLQHLPGAAAGELARRLAEAEARTAGTAEAVRLATPISAAQYAEEIGASRGTPAAWVRQRLVAGHDGRRAPRGSWIAADPRRGAKR